MPGLAGRFPQCVHVPATLCAAASRRAFRDFLCAHAAHRVRPAAAFAEPQMVHVPAAFRAARLAPPAFAALARHAAHERLPGAAGDEPHMEHAAPSGSTTPPMPALRVGALKAGTRGARTALL